MLRTLIATIALVSLAPSLVFAQSTALQQKVAAVEAAAYKNMQMLGEYTWQQQETVSVRGDVKKTALYQVQLGPNGKPVKVDISQSQPQHQRRFGIRHRITEDYLAYGQQIARLVGSYTQLQPGRIKQLYTQGSVALRSGGAPGLDTVVISNYVKPGDVVTITFDRAQKAVVAIQVGSYLDGPSDVVTIAAQFAKLPDGTSHVATATVNGQSKSLTIQDVNMNYQKRTN
ncbi:MAG TPA: hypothetical protein VK702_09080 [Candidatus Acidoferrum sp.]|nr:hypothetical protein [Candidatus Acidoferrum sp.]